MKFKQPTSVLTASPILFSAASAIPDQNISAADLCVTDTSTSYQTIQGFEGIEKSTHLTYAL